EHGIRDFHVTGVQTCALPIYGQGEVQYLLGDWRTASIIFQDLVSDPESAKDPNHPEALFFLADALYQQGNLYGARIYLRELLAQIGRAPWRESGGVPAMAARW